MTLDKDFKKLIRARMDKTGESYSVAREMLLRLRRAGTSAGEPKFGGTDVPADGLKAGDAKVAGAIAPLDKGVKGTTDLVPYQMEIDLDAEPLSAAEPDSEDEGPTEEESDDPEMEWESNAREAVESALREGTFSVDEDDEGVVTLPRVEDGSNHMSDVECRSVESLVDELRERAIAGWQSAVPWENGAVFEFPGDDLIYEALSDYEDELAKLGWEL